MGTSEQAPTLDEIRSWPAAVTLPKAATAFGISKSHAYSLVKSGSFPARTVPFGASVRVVTASIIEVLGG
jgi:predicted DNA-binding transcriptional regulator AlpA